MRKNRLEIFGQNTNRTSTRDQLVNKQDNERQKFIDKESKYVQEITIIEIFNIRLWINIKQRINHLKNNEGKNNF